MLLLTSDTEYSISSLITLYENNCHGLNMSGLVWRTGMEDWYGGRRTQMQKTRCKCAGNDDLIIYSNKKIRCVAEIKPGK